MRVLGWLHVMKMNECLVCVFGWLGVIEMNEVGVVCHGNKCMGHVCPWLAVHHENE